MPDVTNVTNVDLSLCQPGDVCQYPDGTLGVITAWHYGDGYPWWASRGADGKEYAHNREGRRDRLRQLEFDIVRVTRDGQTITPVPVAGEQAAYPNAGPGCDLGRYRTGEVPMVGDVIRMHEEAVEKCGPPAFAYRQFFGVESTVVDFNKHGVMIFRSGDESDVAYPARFDLVRRAAPAHSAAPASEPAERLADIEAKNKVLVEALQAIKVRLHFMGWPAETYWKPHNKWIPDWRKEIAILERALHGTPIDESRFDPPGVPHNQIPKPDQPAAGPAGQTEAVIMRLIDKPGEYQTELFDDTNDARHVAVVLAIKDGYCYGFPATLRDMLLVLRVFGVEATVPEVTT